MIGEHRDIQLLVEMGVSGTFSPGLASNRATPDLSLLSRGKYRV
jgi:hypothetical protein